jgi:hypothetical protein
MSIINNHKCSEKFSLVMTEISANSAQSTLSLTIELRKEKKCMCFQPEMEKKGN